jgi:DHA2 family multidrug resistance protein
VPPAPAVWRPSANRWLIAASVSLAAFMEVLDTSIANVALPHIAGNLGASTDESTWVLTSYLVSNAIVLPISGWLVMVFGRKRLFMTCIVIFTIASLLCGIAPTLGILLFARVLQGAGGGGLQPMAQAILADSFPPEERGLAIALYGITAVFAPSIGPTLGGWLTDNYSWRWVFLINLPVGLLTLYLVRRLVEDPPYLKKARSGILPRLDILGFSLLVLGIGALQIFLDKGQEDDWLSSRFIVALMVISVICLTALVIREWNHEAPIIDIRLLRNRNFAASNVVMFMIGVMAFSTTVLMPQFLQTLMGYTAQNAGMVLSVAGFMLLLGLPVVGRLTTRVQARYLMGAGWLMLTVAMYVSTKRLDLEISFGSAVWLRVVQYVPFGLLFIPANTVAYNGIPAEKSNSVAALMNFVRNVGSSVGTSIVTTVIARRAQFHQAMLVNSAVPGDPRFQGAVTSLADRLHRAGATNALPQAQELIYRQVGAQASTLAYIDSYWILAVASAAMFLLCFVLEPNDPRRGTAVAAH